MLATLCRVHKPHRRSETNPVLVHMFKQYKELSLEWGCALRVSLERVSMAISSSAEDAEGEFSVALGPQK